jgi:hypothetical protein
MAGGGPIRWPEIAAILLSAVWTATVLGYVWRLPEGQEAPGALMTVLILLLPLAPVWATVVTLRAVRTLREEAAFLRAAVDTMKKAAPPAGGAGAQARHAAPSATPSATPSAAVPAPAAAAAFLPAAREDPATFVTRRDPARAALPPSPRPDEQPALALLGQTEPLVPPVSPADFIRALNFPEDANDREGFRAMRAALSDRTAAKLIRAAQDVLTLLSQQGIYTDDLAPDRAQPDHWRRFAQGARGREVAALGGVRDRDALAIVAHRMREDPIFRDAGHHFLRSFDRAFSAFETQASDADLVALSDTRTARAFMLIGRVAGTFD